MKKFFELKKGHIGNVQEASSDTGVHSNVCVCAITVLHEQWMCLGMQRHTHITQCNFDPYLQLTTQNAEFVTAMR